MNELQAGQPVFTATIQIKRAATGKVEEYQVTGTIPEGDHERDAQRDDAEHDSDGSQGRD